MFDKGERLNDVFSLEHFYDFDRVKVQFRNRFFVDQNVLILTEDNKIKVVETKAAAKFLDYFVQMTEALLDTYLIMLLLIDQICGKAMIIPVRKLITVMHESLLMLHAE